MTQNYVYKLYCKNYAYRFLFISYICKKSINCMHTLYKKFIFISCSKIFTKSYEVKILRHKNCNKNEKKRHVLLLPHMRIAALLMPDASVCFCVQAGHVACEPGGRRGRNRAPGRQPTLTRGTGIPPFKSGVT